MDYPALMDPRNMGILAAAFQGLQASGPSRMPVSLGQVIGQGGMAGIGAFQQANEAQRKYEQTQAVIALEQQKAAQAALTTQVQAQKLNGFREMLGLPPIGVPSAPLQVPQGGATGVPGGFAPPAPTQAPPSMGAAPTAPSAASAAPAPSGNRFDQLTSHLPPAQKEAAKLAALNGDEAGFIKAITTGHLQNVQGIGLLQWDPQKQDYTLPAAQETALAARTRTAEQAKADIADASTPAEFTFGTGMNARKVNTTRAIVNALSNGVAPNEEVALAATQLAARNGQNVTIGVRNPGGSGLTNAQPTPEEAAASAARGKFLGGRAETAVAYERGLNEKVSQGSALDSRLDEMKTLIQDFKTGGGAPVRVRLAETAQALGMDKKTVDGIANGDLGSIQAFEKLQIQGAMESLRVAMTNSSGAGAGRITQAEFQIFLKANPNIALDPRGLDKIINFQKWAIAVDKAEQKGFGEWVKDGKDPADWPAEFAQNRDKILKAQGIESPDAARQKWSAEKAASAAAYQGKEAEDWVKRAMARNMASRQKVIEEGIRLGKLPKDYK